MEMMKERTGVDWSSVFATVLLIASIGFAGVGVVALAMFEVSLMLRKIADPTTWWIALSALTFVDFLILFYAAVIVSTWTPKS